VLLFAERPCLYGRKNGHRASALDLLGAPLSFVMGPIGSVVYIGVKSPRLPSISVPYAIPFSSSLPTTVPRLGLYCSIEKCPFDSKNRSLDEKENHSGVYSSADMCMYDLSRVPVDSQLRPDKLWLARGGIWVGWWQPI
jgi:hypothetical protein